MDKMQEKKISINDMSSSSFYQKEIDVSKVDVNNLKKKMNERKAQDAKTTMIYSLGALAALVIFVILLTL